MSEPKVYKMSVSVGRQNVIQDWLDLPIVQVIWLGLQPKAHMGQLEFKEN